MIQIGYRIELALFPDEKEMKLESDFRSLFLRMQ
jgi:hypothetical protein